MKPKWYRMIPEIHDDENFPKNHIWTLKNAIDAAADGTAATINDDDTSIKWHNNWIFT